MGESSSCSKDATPRVRVERSRLLPVSPRVFRIVALPAPSDRQKTEMFMQRYMEHFPAAGEIIIFDRSWYNRAVAASSGPSNLEETDITTSP